MLTSKYTPKTHLFHLILGHQHRMVGIIVEGYLQELILYFPLRQNQKQIFG